MGLREELGSGPIGIDSVVFIYYIEDRVGFSSALAPIFEDIDRGVLPALTSSVTLLEVLVVPYRAGDLALAERYEALLTRSRGLRMVEMDRSTLRAAAKLRAVHPGLRTPDALQLASALGAGCKAFLTNDRDLPSLPGLRVLQLRDYC